MPMYVTKGMQRHWILGVLAAALWIAPAAAQTTGGTSGTTGSTGTAESDRSGQATGTHSQTTADTGSTSATSGTGSGAETDRAGQANATQDSQTTAGTGSTRGTTDKTGKNAKGKHPGSSILDDDDPGAWPRSGRSASDRGR